MPISDDARLLHSLASVELPQQLVQQASGLVTGNTEEACGAVGQGTAEAQELFDAGQKAVEACNTATAAINAFYDRCGVIATRHM
jgi:hypothetical protein